MALSDDPARLRPESYPLSFSHRVIYADMDGFRHLNNGATTRYFEEGRSELNMGVFGTECMVDPPDGLQLLFATVTVDYLAQAYYPGTVTIHSGVARIGRTSWTPVHAAFQNGTCFALGESVMVKARHGTPEPLTQHERAALAEVLLRT